MPFGGRNIQQQQKHGWYVCLFSWRFDGWKVSFLFFLFWMGHYCFLFNLLCCRLSSCSQEEKTSFSFFFISSTSQPYKRQLIIVIPGISSTNIYHLKHERETAEERQDGIWRWRWGRPCLWLLQNNLWILENDGFTKKAKQREINIYIWYRRINLNLKSIWETRYFLPG